MRKLSGMFKSIYTVLGYQQYSPRKSYVQLPYLIDLDVDEGKLLLNVMTRELFLLSKKEWEAWKSGEPEESMRRDMVRHWFMIPKELDAKSLWYSVSQCHMERFGEKNTGKIEFFTIFTTTECNAACPYCYEQGCQKRSMHKAVAADVAAWICAHGNPDKTHLKWFGGEPLCNSKVIDIICQELKDRVIQYESSMVSNGLLINEHDADKLLNLWKLNRVQITLDGTREHYNKVKNFKCVGNPYEQVMDNIKYLLSLGIRVDARLNISTENADDLMVLVSELRERFSDCRDNLMVYSHPLFLGTEGAASGHEHVRLYDQYITLQDHISECGIGSKRGFPRVRHSHCMADDGKSVVVLPGGELSLCEHHCDDEFYGTIYSDDYDKDVIQSWKEPADEIPECVDCFYYPVCTRIMKCPGKGACNEDQRRYEKHKLQLAMLEIYKKRIGKENVHV